MGWFAHQKHLKLNNIYTGSHSDQTSTSYIQTTYIFTKGHLHFVQAFCNSHPGQEGSVVS